MSKKTVSAVIVSCLAIPFSLFAAAPDWVVPNKAIPSFMIEMDTNQTGKVEVPVKISAMNQGVVQTKTFVCVADKGISSQALVCPNTVPFNVPLVKVSQKNNKITFTASLQDFSNFVLPWKLTKVEDDPEMVTSAAVPRWVDGWFSDYWVCDIDVIDREWCQAKCFGPGLVDSLSATPVPANASQDDVPDCEVTCVCKDRTSSSWTDAPQGIIMDWFWR